MIIFAFFTLHDQLDPPQKHLSQVEEMQRSNWLICQSTNKFVAHQVVSLMKNEQQSKNLLHKVDPRSTFRDNFLQPATNVFVARQVDHARWKTRNIDQNLQRNKVARQSWGFLYLVFRRLYKGLNGFFRKVSHSFQNLWIALQTFSLKRSSQKAFLIPKFVLNVYTINLKLDLRFWNLFARLLPKLVDPITSTN